MGLAEKLQKAGNPRLTTGENIFSMFCFFVFGLNFLIYYNAVVNVGDLLATEFGDFELDFMSTYPLFLNWFNFFFAFGLVIAATVMKRFPYNLLIHVHFIIYIVLFIVTPVIINFIEDNVVRFWVMVIMTVIGGIPCQLSGGVVTSLAGLFSSNHNTIFLVGSSSGGIIVSLLRIMAHAILGDDRVNDYYLSLWCLIIVVVISYILYFFLYYYVPFTRIVIKESYGEVERETDAFGQIIELSEDSYEMKNMNKMNEMKDNFNEQSDENSSDSSGVEKTLKKSKRSKYESDEIDNENDTILKQFLRVFSKTWVQLVTLAIDYFWTFCVFAGIFLQIPYDESVMSLSVAQQVTTFCFMGGDALARILALIPIKYNKWLLLILTLARGLFYIPIFIYFYGVYTNPYLMFFIMLVFSTTHGLFASGQIGLCFASSLPKDMKMTANFCNLCLDLGLALGATGLFVLKLVLPSNAPDGSLS